MATASSRFANEEIKFAILDYFASVGSQEKYNFLGRGGMPGNIDSKLAAELTSNERKMAGRAFDELYEERFLEHNTMNIVGTGDWYEITQKGKEALSSHSLDDLDKVLNTIDPNLKLLRCGAREASKDYASDRVRQGAHSARELVRQVLAKLAPNEEVIQQSWYIKPKDASSPVTRAMRIKLVLSKTMPSSKSDVAVIEAACEYMEALHDKLIGEAHLDVNKKHGDLQDLINSVESALKRLLIK